MSNIADDGRRDGPRAPARPDDQLLGSARPGAALPPGLLSLLFPEGRSGIVELHRRIVAAQEDERRRLARDLHDQLGQRLTALRIQLHELRHGAMTSDQMVDWGLRELARVMEELRNTVNGLDPSWPHDGGLGLALSVDVPRRLLAVGVRCVVESEDVPGLAAEAQLAIYRVVQEAVTNVIRHAAATTVRVALRRADGAVAVEVSDDGVGFDPQRAGAGAFGLKSMRERCIALGGTLDVASAAGAGTRIAMRIPCGPLAAET